MPITAPVAASTAPTASTGGEYEHTVTQIRITRAQKSRSGGRMARHVRLEIAMITFKLAFSPSFSAAFLALAQIEHGCSNTLCLRTAAILR